MSSIVGVLKSLKTCCHVPLVLALALAFLSLLQYPMSFLWKQNDRQSSPPAGLLEIDATQAEAFAKS